MSTRFPIWRSRFGTLGRRRHGCGGGRFGLRGRLGLGGKLLNQPLTLAAQDTQNRPGTDQRCCDGKPVHGGYLLSTEWGWGMKCRMMNAGCRINAKKDAAFAHSF
jgi:hypothetical protein